MPGPGPGARGPGQRWWVLGCLGPQRHHPCLHMAFPLSGTPVLLERGPSCWSCPQRLLSNKVPSAGTRALDVTPFGDSVHGKHLPGLFRGEHGLCEPSQAACGPGGRAPCSQHLPEGPASVLTGPPAFRRHGGLPPARPQLYCPPRPIQTGRCRPAPDASSLLPWGAVGGPGGLCPLGPSTLSLKPQSQILAGLVRSVKKGPRAVSLPSLLLPGLGLGGWEGLMSPPVPAGQLGPDPTFSRPCGPGGSRCRGQSCKHLRGL